MLFLAMDMNFFFGGGEGPEFCRHTKWISFSKILFFHVDFRSGESGFGSVGINEVSWHHLLWSGGFKELS